MACRIETTTAGLWTFCPELPVPRGARLRALARARLVDEITEQPLAADALEIPDARLALHVAARIADNGIVGLAGFPQTAFPQLALQPAPLAFRVRADGFWPEDLATTLVAQPGFPTDFTLADFGTVLMRRRGVSLAGRVVARDLPANVPLVNASIVVDGVWPTAPPPGVTLAASMQAPDMAGLAPGLYRAWTAAVASACTFTPDLAHAKTAPLATVPGATRIRLSNRQFLAINQPLSIDPDAGREEVIAISAIDAGLADDQPAWIDLHYPIRRLHRPGARVVPLSVTATSGLRNLARPAGRGDVIAFFTAAPPWLDDDLVRITDGIAPFEYQRVARFAAISDALGYWRLPPLARLALVQLRANHVSQPNPLLAVVTLEYRHRLHDPGMAFE